MNTSQWRHIVRPIDSQLAGKYRQIHFQPRRCLSDTAIPSFSKTCKLSRANCRLQHTFSSHPSPLPDSVPRSFSASRNHPEIDSDHDPRVSDLGKTIIDDFAAIRAKYKAPQYPIVLAHGLLGFDELRLAGQILPGIQYWRGISDALRSNGIEVITASVPALASIEERAKRLGAQIAEKAQGKNVNIIAHSMGGLDARFLISRMRLPGVGIKSLTTIATPHRGSAFADFMIDAIGPVRLPKIFSVLARLDVQTGAFEQLTQRYLQKEFNPATPDSPDVRYFSYGAKMTPSLWSSFRQSHRIVLTAEGPNDGLVSVSSSKWGTYKGTLMEVNHLDLINWTNRLRWLLREWTGNRRNFNAVALYLDIADMLAQEGF